MSSTEDDYPCDITHAILEDKGNLFYITINVDMDYEELKMANPKSIFISHSSKDDQFARRLAADLAYYGIKAWLDDADISLSDLLTQKITGGIEQTDYFSVIISSNSINSSWVRKELELAKKKELSEKRNLILPILLENVALPDDIRGDILDRVYADFSHEDLYAWTFQKMLKLLNYKIDFHGKLSIFSESLTLGWQNASWRCEFDDKCIQYMYNGKRSFRAKLRGFGGVAFAFRSGVHTEGFSKLEFYINGGEIGGQELKVFVNDRPGDGVKTPVILDSLAADKWTLINIPLKDLDAENITIVKINISDLSGRDALDFYLADMSLVS